MNLLYIDETAFVEGWDEFSASVLPTISSGETTKVLYTSTPNGLNHFYKICVGGREGTNGYAYVEVPWYRVPGRDEKWKKEALETLDGDYQKFAQEYECVTGDTLITLRDKISGEIKTVRIDSLYQL
jgi:phage FluMu gp28-like protein